MLNALLFHMLVGGRYSYYLSYRFSGSIASSAFKQFQNRLTKRVFIFGPCHHYYTEYIIFQIV